MKQLLLIAILKKSKKFLKNDFLVDKKNVSKKKYFKTNTRKKNGLTAPGKMSEEEKDKIIDWLWDKFCEEKKCDEKMSEEEKNKILDWWWEIFFVVTASLDKC